MIDFLQLFESPVYASDLDPDDLGEQDWLEDFIDDPYPITVVIRDKHHRYESLGGVMYEIGNEDNTHYVDTEEIQATEGNQFYEDHIERYIEYLQYGGVIETFPVQHIEPQVMSLSAMVDEILNDSDLLFEFLDEFKSGVTLEWKRDYKEVDRLLEYASWIKPWMYKSWEEALEALGEDGLIEGDIDEDGWDNMLELLDDVNTFRKNNAVGEEWHLNDMNHRFEAVKRMGVSTVIVEVI